MIYIRRSAIQYIYIDIYFVINEMENLSNEEQACQQVISRSTFFFRLLLLPVPPPSSSTPPLKYSGYRRPGRRPVWAANSAVPPGLTGSAGLCGRFRRPGGTG